MTNKEMAIELGNKMIQLQGQIEVLEGIFMEYKITGPDGHHREIPWKELAISIANEPGSLLVADARTQQLHDALQDATDATSLTSLYQTFCRTQ
jgi:hypothetical protein